MAATMFNAEPARERAAAPTTVAATMYAATLV